MSHQSDGKIEESCLENFGMPGFIARPLHKSKFRSRRKKGGCIEIGNEGVNEVVWSPAIKIGAKVGEEWEREVTPGHTERCVVKRMGLAEIVVKRDGSKEKVAAAHIEIRHLASALSANIELLEELALGRGLGPIKRTMWRTQEGEKRNCGPSSSSRF